jgi:hypothetical protein
MGRWEDESAGLMRSSLYFLFDWKWNSDSKFGVLMEGKGKRNMKKFCYEKDGGKRFWLLAHDLTSISIEGVDDRWKTKDFFINLKFVLY